MTRVLIVDDHRIFAEALALALSSEDDIDCVATADGVTTAIDLTDALRPDVVVMDVRLGDGDGIWATAELKHRFPEVRVVVLTAFPDAALVSRVSAAHASALLPKDGELGEMLQVLRHEESDEFYVHPRLHTSLVAEDVTTRVRIEPLPQQEQDVLRMLVAGLDPDAIGRELGVPEETARRCIRSLLAKLGAQTRFDALVIAMRNGLIRADPVD
jgi:DNA-binding NarL/FixJ family response regulator